VGVHGHGRTPHHNGTVPPEGKNGSSAARAGRSVGAFWCISPFASASHVGFERKGSRRATGAFGGEHAVLGTVLVGS
jgi:hypothetical protein